MQAPRNWRMKEKRYRLVGSENMQGDKSIVNRPASLLVQTKVAEKLEQLKAIKINAA